MATDTAVPPSVTVSNPASLLRGRDIVCFSHDWSGDPLSKTHLMRLLARENRILWVNSIGYRAPTASRSDIGRAIRKLAAAAIPMREVEKNIFVLNPLAFPAYRRSTLRALNQRFLCAQVRKAMARLRFQRPISWVFNPAAGLLAGQLDEEFLIYYCVDEYSAFTGVSSQALAETEEHLLRRADAVFVSAERLYHTKARSNRHTFLVRHGVDFDHFRLALEPDVRIPEDISQLPRPIIGYFGLIGQDWVDLDLLIHVAERFPKASLVMLGKATMDVSRLARFPNVHLLGRKPYTILPSYCKAFDVALIPFPVTEVTLNANPLKAREYLAAGLPVVSTAIPEVEVLGQCRIGAGPEAFVREIEAALASPGPQRKRSDAMRNESWSARLDCIREHLAILEGNTWRTASPQGTR
jgi:glycosyltransferase involved in cell wall biosynthesis